MHSFKARFLRKRYVIPSIATVVALAAAGTAYGYFTTTGGGTGSAQVGKASSVVIAQLSGAPIYNSRIPAADYQASQCYYCVQMGDFGNKITFANPEGLSLPLGDVTVDMANFGTTTGFMDITFKVFAPPDLTTPIASDKQSFYIPATSTGWIGTASDPTLGIDNFSVTFDNFSPANVLLPPSVVYDIQYNDPQNAVTGGVNVQLSTEPGQISTGSDADPAMLFASLASTAGGNGYDYSYNDVGPGEITTSLVNTTFAEYSTVGEEAPYVPAVQFDTVGYMNDLYPGGPAQPVDFTVTNPGSSPVTVGTVTISVPSDINGLVLSDPTNTGSGVAGCYADWFAINGSYSSATVTVNQSIPSGNSILVVGKASISMMDNGEPQDGCQGAQVGLKFTSP
jgi:hypothetical protein